MHEKDREVRKQLVKYVNKVNLDAVEGKEADDNYDYTPEGIKISLESLYLNIQSDQLNTVVEKAKYSYI